MANRRRKKKRLTLKRKTKAAVAAAAKAAEKKKRVEEDSPFQKYYDPRAPGSFGGVDGLVRLLKGVKDKQQIKEWLSDQRPYTLHFPVRRRFRRNVTLVNNINEQFQADLVDLSALAHSNDGYKYILTCIDVFSKYGWAIPMKNKTAATTREAFEQIFSERQPEKLQTDRGKEFENAELLAYLKEKGIHFFYSYNPDIKCSIVERFNRTLKSRMWRYLTYKNSNRYIDVLPDIMHSINHSYHRSIKMAPVDVNEGNVKEVWNNLFGHIRKRVGQPKYKFNVGDFVRISSERVVFRKGYEEGWTEEVFVVSEQKPRDPVVYKLKDDSGEDIKGTFYEKELLKVKKPELYQVEKVLQTRGVGKNRECLVKWKGYPESFNKWIPASEIVDI